MHERYAPMPLMTPCHCAQTGRVNSVKSPIRFYFSYRHAQLIVSVYATPRIAVCSLYQVPPRLSTLNGGGLTDKGVFERATTLASLADCRNMKPNF